MADRTVRVKLSGNARDLESALDSAGRKADATNAKLEALDGKEISGRYDLDTSEADRKAKSAYAEGQKYDKSRFTAKYSAEVDDTVRRTQEEMEKIGRTRARSGMVEDLRQAKKEFADLKKQMAGHTPKLDLDIRDAQRKRDQLKRSLKALEDGKTDPRIDLNIKRAEAKRNDLRRKLRELSDIRATPEVSADIKRFEANLGLVELDLKKLRASRNKPAIEADISQLRRDVERADNVLDNLRAKRVSPKVGLRAEELERKIAEYEAQLKAFDRESYEMKLRLREEGLQRKLDGIIAKAEEAERKRQMKIDADTAKAHTEVITLDAAADNATRYRSMNIGVNRNALTEIIRVGEAADNAAHPRTMNLNTSDLHSAREAADRLKFAADMAARDRRLKINGDFAKTRAEAAALYRQMQDMANNSWRVRVNPEFRQAFAEAAALNNRLDRAARDRLTSIKVTEIGDGNSKIAALNAQLDKFGRTNATATVGLRGDRNVRGRMQMIMGAVTAFAPAVTSASSAAGASLVSLTTILMGGVAVAGAGFAAFKGLGDAISAAGANAMNPTAANAKKLQEALKDANMETREFVLTLGQYAPLLKSVQNIARAGMFPGMIEGLNAANAALPNLVTLVDRASRSLGQMAKATGESLGSPDWREYFDFLGAVAVPQFASFMASIGRIISGFKDLQMAMDPFTRDFVDGFTRMSTEFQRWAEGLENNRSFQDWLAYVRDVGPQVMQTLGSIVEMFGAIGAAMQPVAPIVLQIIKTFADMITTLMEIPVVGSLIMGLVTAFGMMRMAGLLLKATGLAAMFRGIAAGAGAMRAGAGALGVWSAAAAAAGRNGRTAAGGVTAVGGAATRAGSQAGKGAAGASKFTGALRGVGGALPVVGIALFGLAAALDANNTSFDEGFDKWQRGGQVAAEYTAELQKNSDMARQNVNDMGPLIGGIFNTASQWVRGADTLESYNQKLNEQRASMGEAAFAQIEAQRAQTELNEAIARYGPNSQQAADAAGHLAYANARVALHTELANKVGQDYYTTLGNIAGREDEAGNAARMLMGGMSGVEVAATGATISIDGTGRAIATLPNGKRVQIDADTKNAAFQLATVQSHVDTIPPGKTVNVGVISAPAQAALRQMGFEVRQLPNGKVEVTAKTDEAKNQLRILTQFGEAIRVNPKITAEPGLAYDTLLKFVNDSNAAAGKPKLEPRTNEANLAVAQMAQGWNNISGNPKVNPDTTHANAKVGAWKAYAEGLIPAPKVNADTRPAHGQAFQWSNATQRLEPVPRVNANSGPGWGVSMRWNDQTSSLEPVPAIDANPAQANDKSRRWEGDTARMNPRPRVDADDSGARGTVRGFMAWVGSQVVSIAVRAKTALGFAEGGAVGGYADGGPIQHAAKGLHVRSTRTLGTGRLVGPGSGTSDSIPIMAANGEWVIRRSISAIQGAAKMALLNAGKADIVPHADRFRSAIQQSMPTRVHVPAGVKTGAHTSGDTTVTNYVTVNNPRAERASDSIQRGLSRMAEMGMFG